MTELLEILDCGKVIASVKLTRIASGCVDPVFSITHLNVAADRRNEGMGSRLLENLNNYLDSMNAVGFLVDGLELKDNDPRVYGMYERHGWIKIDDHLMIYGVQNDKS